MISNQTVINTAIATNIAARAIHNTKATRISSRKTNNFHYVVTFRSECSGTGYYCDEKW